MLKIGDKVAIKPWNNYYIDVSVNTAIIKFDDWGKFRIWKDQVKYDGGGKYWEWKYNVSGIKVLCA